jgi:two-component system chemotaxis response regulator CheY
MQDALIIDDNRNTADALKQMLEVLGIAARVAYGSSPALGILTGFVPSVVMLDINMPGLDGTEVLSYLKREPRLCRIPVIIITSDDQPETRQRVMKGGASGLIVKPATIDSLEAALQKARIL